MPNLIFVNVTRPLFRKKIVGLASRLVSICTLVLVLGLAQGTPAVAQYNQTYQCLDADYMTQQACSLSTYDCIALQTAASVCRRFCDEGDYDDCRWVYSQCNNFCAVAMRGGSPGTGVGGNGGSGNSGGGQGNGNNGIGGGGNVGDFCLSNMSCRAGLTCDLTYLACR